MSGGYVHTVRSVVFDGDHNLEELEEGPGRG
jgi:hypothetical protein